MSRPYAAAVSSHPEPPGALGEVAGHLLEHGAEGAGLLTVFVTPHYAGALEDIAAALHTLLDPKVMIGCASTAVLANGQAFEHAPAIAAWAGDVGPVEALRMEVADRPDGGGRALSGWPLRLPWVPAAAIMFADPFSFPVSPLFDVLNNAGGFPRVMGGMTSAGQAPGQNRLVLNGNVFEHGAVGVLIGADENHWIEPVTSPGTRPIGSPFVVTKADDNIIFELGGEPAVSRLRHMVRTELSDEDATDAAAGVVIGRVIDEHQMEFGPRDFVVRTIVDADEDTGTIVVGDRIPAGTTVQFQVIDRDTATESLEASLTERDAEGALLFAGVGRDPDADEFDAGTADAAITALTLGAPTAGCITAGEFAPVGDTNLIHGFSASMALFGHR